MKRRISRVFALSMAFAMVLGAMPTVAFARIEPAEVTDEEVLSYAYWDTSLSDEERAADLISHMTVAEKASQLGSHPAAAIDRLGVAEYWYPGENLNGIANISLWYGNEAGDAQSAATSFPSTLAQGSTWNPGLIAQMGDAIGDEARAFYNTSKKGLSHWGPSVNLARDPRWGRTGDSFTEDVLLSSAMGSAFVQGFQGDLDESSDYLKAIACVKHFAANNAEAVRSSGSSNASEAELREYYLRHFENMVEDAEPACVMAAYNAINGVPCHGSYELLTSILRQTWGFQGWVVSDNTGVENLSSQYGKNGANVEKGDAEHFPVLDGAVDNGSFDLDVDTMMDAAVASIRSGVSLDLQARIKAYQTYLGEAVELNQVDETVLDEALLEIFTTRFATGEFDFAGDYTEGYQSVQAFIEQHQDLAEDVADEAIVLLENKDGFLPADLGDYETVLVVGQYIEELLYSDYKSNQDWRIANGVDVSFVEGIQAAVDEYNAEHKTKIQVESCVLEEDEDTGKVSLPDDGQGGQAWNRKMTDNKTLTIYIPSTRITMMSSGADAGEGNDRDSLALPRGQEALGKELVQQAAHLVVACHTQSIVDIEWAREADAVLWASYLGEKQGTALANVLFGKVNPSGHLTTTWYSDVSQLADLDHDYSIYDSDGEADGDYGRTYLYFTGDVSYPFGYGLSYTTFEYSGFTLDKTSATGDDTVTATVTVTNTGGMAGQDVVQIYAAGPNAARSDRPARQLIGFQKVALEAGESKTISIPMDLFDLACWNEEAARFEMDLGEYTFTVNTDADAAVCDPVAVQCTADAVPALKCASVSIDDFILRSDSATRAGVSVSLKNDTLYAAVEDMPDTMSVTYASSNPAAAVVSDTGVITPVANGVTTITATVVDLATGASATDSHPVVVVDAYPFTDVPAGSWYYKVAEAAAAEGIMNGIGDGQFGGEREISFGEVLTILYRLTTGAAAAGDTEAAIAWAAENGITAGEAYTAGQPITRQDMITFLGRYAQKIDGAEITAQELAFADKDSIAEYAVPYVSWAVENHIMNGRGNDLFVPDGTATRAEFAKIVICYLY